ncbi:MAG: hypothetical protein ACRYFY_17030 [Janthinobacterium lividum]
MIGTAAIALLAYMALIEAGHWGSDEYYIAAFNASTGWRSVLGRMVRWSPRPFSEAVSALYLTLCHWLKHSFVVPFLLLLWLGSIAVIAAAARRAGEVRPILFAVVLFVLALMLCRPDEMFYWPMATVAYLSSWAGLAAVTALRRADTSAVYPPSSLLMTGMLLLAAFSVEIGAVTVLLDAVLWVMVAPVRLPGRPASAGFRRSRLQAARAGLVPALAGLLICISVYVSRMRPMVEVLDRSSLLAGNWLRSFEAAVPIFAHELVGIPGLPVLAAILLKLAILLVLPPPGASTGPATRRRIVWAVSLLLGAFLSVALSLHQFGMLCCQRHQTMRAGMILLALVALAPSSALLWRRLPAGLREMLLAGVLLLLLAVWTPALKADFALIPEHMRTRSTNWSSARGPEDAMLFTVPPPGRLFGGPFWPSQIVRLRDGQVPAYGAEGIAAFFGKHEMTIVQSPR